MERWDEDATALADVARDLVNQDSIDSTLDRIVAHTTHLVEGCTAASVLVLDHGKPRTLASTGAQAAAVDRVQAELRQGPCYTAVLDRHRVYRLTDTGAAEQWPELAAKAHALGVGSMLGFLLYTNGNDNLGALNLYGAGRQAFGERAEHLGWVVASYCAVALSVARHEDAMQRALRNSRAIGIAVGILMNRYRIVEDEAFALLSGYSQDHNIRVHELAEDVRRTGDLPAR